MAAAQRAAKVAGASAGQWWKRLSDAAESTTTQQSLDSLFRDAIVAMRNALEVDTVAVLLANEAGDELVARVATGLSEESTLHLGVHSGQGMAGWVLANRRPLIVADLSKITVVTPALRDSGLHSIVAVPLLADERPIGVMYAGSYEFDRFNASDVGMLELIADRLAAAIERVRLFEAERAARTEAERLADRLARTQAVTARLVATATVEEIGAALAETLVEGEPGRGSVWTSVRLLDAGVLVPVSVVSSDQEGPPLQPISLDADHPIAEIARQTTPAYFDDPDTGARFPVIGRAFPDGNLAVIPIMLGPTCLGVFTAAYRPGHRFTIDERDFLEAVVAQVAQALERARLASARDQLAQVSAFFAEAARVLAEGEDLTDTLDRLASVALPTLGDICLIDVVSDDGRLVRMIAKHREPSRQHMVDRLRTRYAPDPAGSHPAASVIATGQTSWSAQMGDDFLEDTTRDEEHLSLVKSLGFRSYISVPLHAEARVLGCVSFVSTSRAFGPEDVTFAEQLADQVAALVSKARRYDIVTRTSHILQSSLLPRSLPGIPGLASHTRYVASSEGLEVGGDFYDLVAVTKDRVAFMIGDVAGHDRGAAALMGQLRSAARTLVSRVDSPAELVTALQQSWSRLDFDRMATAVFGQLEVATGELAMASAGHYPPLLVDHDAARYLPVEPSPPLGVRGGYPTDWRGWLKTDQALLLYTDGAIDERRAGSEASMEELARAARPAAEGRIDLAALCDRVVDTLIERRRDDVALLALTLDPIL